jgi:BirA family biotin operon repressor/biotin-[acetyl-CoA-carboxylase] ligase
MPPNAAAGAPLFDGVSAADLASLLALPRVVLFHEVSSTLDIAHELGEAGAPPGTLVIADAQTAGRGRMRRSWRSEPGAGLWLTFVERPEGGELGVLALRLAIALAPTLDRFAGDRIQLKWPNDLYVRERKLAGLLVEARWRGTRVDWLAVGLGINVRAPDIPGAAGLTRGARRVEILRAIVPAVRGAVTAPGALTPDEVAIFRQRDLALGRRCAAPALGTVAGIAADGALLVDTATERIACYAGSLVLTTDAHSGGETV